MNSSEGACAVRFSVLHTAGLAPKIIIGFLIAFFPILIDTVIGLRSVETESIFLLQSMGADRWKTFRYVRLPNALPNLFGGMKVAITLAVVGAIVGEFIGANEGLGYVLLFANGILDTQLLFAALVAISLLALVFYAVINLLERIFIRWHVSVRVRDRHHVIRPGDRPRRRHADVRDRHAVIPPGRSRCSTRGTCLTASSTSKRRTEPSPGEGRARPSPSDVVRRAPDQIARPGLPAGVARRRRSDPPSTD